MPLTEESPIEKALYKIVGAPSAKSGGTDDSSSFQFAPRSSYTPGLFEGRGGTTDASSGQTASPYNAPATGAATAFQATNTIAPVQAAAATPAAVTPAATTAPAAAAAAPAAAATPAKPALMSLRDYDAWMTELGNQKQAQEAKAAGRNVYYYD